jgi:hypothetical protein
MLVWGNNGSYQFGVGFKSNIFFILSQNSLKSENGYSSHPKESLIGSASCDKDKIDWVSWKDACLPKEWGLGVKDLKWFNLSFAP